MAMLKNQMVYQVYCIYIYIERVDGVDICKHHWYLVSILNNFTVEGPEGPHGAPSCMACIPSPTSRFPEAGCAWISHGGSCWRCGFTTTAYRVFGEKTMLVDPRVMLKKVSNENGFAIGLKSTTNSTVSLVVTGRTTSQPDMWPMHLVGWNTKCDAGRWWMAGEKKVYIEN